MNNYLCLLWIILFTSFDAYSQKRCVSFEKLSKRLESDVEFRLKREEMERQTTEWIAGQGSFTHKKSHQSLISIPVIVHVVHSGESVGVGSNISEDQINSQIVQLNKDFRLLNEDSLPVSHPFWIYTADIGIEFCLADIKRWNYPITSWYSEDFDEQVKPATIVNSSQYLNIWTVAIDDFEATFGYATFPGDDPSKDGVVIDYKYFGTEGSVVAPADGGRTTTHEIGHWLNLQHVWGDQFCGSDLVSDTEPAEQANYGCKTFPHNPNNFCGSGSNGEMYMNYMDYGDDACLVMFTFGQKQRIYAALNQFRSELLTNCSPVSASETNELSLSFFPNPSKSSVFLRDLVLTPDTRVVLYDITGSIIITPPISTGGEIITEHLPSGIYFIHVKNHIGSGTFKIIKQ